MNYPHYYVTRSKESYYLDLDQNRRKKLAQLNTSRMNHGSCREKDFLYVFAGVSTSDQRPVSDIERLDVINGKAWQVLSIPVDLTASISVHQIRPNEFLVAGTRVYDRYLKL